MLTFPFFTRRTNGNVCAKFESMDPSSEKGYSKVFVIESLIALDTQNYDNSEYISLRFSCKSME